MPHFSDYIVYVDESGDHSLTSIDPQYPIFVLAFCAFDKQAYANEAIPALQNLKFDFFGHDMVVLHERDIRKQQGAFTFLTNKETRTQFYGALGSLVEQSPFTLFAVAINKSRLTAQYSLPKNPYRLAIKYGLERLEKFFVSHGQEDKKTHIVFESRGAKEDSQLELAFRRVCDGANYEHCKLPFEAVFASKKINSGGLQLADLVARPIGRHVLEPKKKNRAYESIKQKFCTDSKGSIAGYGLKIFP